MATLHGTFKNLTDEDFEVVITSNIGADDIEIGTDYDSDVFFALNPVEITTNCDDMFTHIIKKSAVINLKSHIYLGSKFFAAKPTDVTVCIYKKAASVNDTDTLLFSGFVEPESFSQPWSHVLDDFTFNCIDYLSVLQYKKFTDNSTYEAVVANAGLHNFAWYLNRFGLSGYHYDNSKKVGQSSALDVCAIPMSVFLGDSEDDLQNYEEILTELLQYLNLHIIQEGNDFYIFDWYSIITDNNNTVQVTKDSYISDSTTIGMSDLYNQISVRVDVQESDEVIDSPVNDSLDTYFDSRQMYCREICHGVYSEYRGTGALNWRKILDHDFQTIDRSMSWAFRDHYVKWMYNNNWRLTFQNSVIDSLFETDGSGNYINEYKVMQHLWTNKFMPALVSMSSREIVRNTTADMTVTKLGAEKDYLVISVRGNGYDDEETPANNIDSASENAAGTDGCIAKYTKTGGTYSPVSDDVTNYLVFSGKLLLAPRVYTSFKSNDGTWSDVYVKSEENVTINRQITMFGQTDRLGNDVPGQAHIWSKLGEESGIDEGYYSLEYYTSQTPTYDQDYVQFDHDLQLMPPPMTGQHFGQYVVNVMHRRGNNPSNPRGEYTPMQFNYSARSDVDERLTILPVLECQLKIGDKYLIQDFQTLNDGTKQQKFSWKTYEECPERSGQKKTTFVLGVSPETGQYIIGKEWDLADTWNGSHEIIGTSVPIKKSDTLFGDLEFKIIGVCDTLWNDIVKYSEDSFSHATWTDLSWRTVLQHVSAIWISDLKVTIDTDNGGKEAKRKEKDIIYLSDEAHEAIRKKDDITFGIFTMLSNQESTDLGLETNIAENTVVNVNTQLALDTITDTLTEQTDRAERLYVDQYYNLYCSPKVIIETDLKLNEQTSFQTFNFPTFGKTIPQTMTMHLRENVLNLTARQI